MIDHDVESIHDQAGAAGARGAEGQGASEGKSKFLNSFILIKSRGARNSAPRMDL
jgi:hypothetical protein